MNACDSQDQEPYDFPLHVGAVFIVFGLALIGTSLPILAKTVKWFRVNDFVFLLLKCFGMGVILATGYIHMLPPAMTSLTNPCLSTIWTEEYVAFAGLFALVATLATQLIQTTAILHFGHNHKAGSDGELNCQPHSHHHDHGHHHHGVDRDYKVDAGQTSSGTDLVPAQKEDSSVDMASVKDDEIPSKRSHTVELGALAVATNIHSDGCCEVEHALIARGEHKHRQITAYILEFGIATHSIIIGITLGVARGPAFIGLLIALGFHQFFEGFALASTAIEAGFRTLKTPLLMAFIYTLITPLGVVIGIAISQNYNENSTAALLTQGIFDAVAAGILIYDALVNLITTNITHSRWFAQISLARRALVILFLWLGAGVMALIGRWA